MGKLTLKDLPLKGKRVLMRVDFNVPLENGAISDDSRIQACLPSIEYILQQGGALILMSHLGRPKGKKDPLLSLSPCARRLSELVKHPVQMAPDCIGDQVEAMSRRISGKEILLLENLRFHPEEEEPDKHPDFTAALARRGEVYVNDAFATAHRAHASTAAITRYFPDCSAMGFLMEKEIKELSSLLSNPERPFYAILGGAKISSKIGVIQKLSSLVDSLFIGGGMVYPFLKEEGIEIGNSISEEGLSLRDIPKKKLQFPLDLVLADRFSNEAETQIIPFRKGIPKGWQGMDIGPATIRDWSQKLQKGKTIFWNGPLGVFEMPNFRKGTQEIGKALAESKSKTIAGGGDSIAAIEQMGLAQQFTYLSTGGGASLEFLEYGTLPGIEALTPAPLPIRTRKTIEKKNVDRKLGEQ